MNCEWLDSIRHGYVGSRNGTAGWISQNWLNRFRNLHRGGEFWGRSLKSCLIKFFNSMDSPEKNLKLSKDRGNRQYGDRAQASGRSTTRLIDVHEVHKSRRKELGQSTAWSTDMQNREDRQQSVDPLLDRTENDAGAVGSAINCQVDHPEHSFSNCIISGRPPRETVLGVSY